MRAAAIPATNTNVMTAGTENGSADLATADPGAAALEGVAVAAGVTDTATPPGEVSYPRRRTTRSYQWPADWGPWDEFTQYRRPHPMRVEFRRSVPLALTVGVLTVLAAFSLTFLGLWVPRQDLGTGLIIAAAGITVFLLGRGVVIDGTRHVVRRWWGWLYRPVLSTACRFSTIRAIEIGRKLGQTVPEYGVGRTLHYPLSLIREGRRPIVVKRCPWVTEARFLAEDLSQLMSVPVSDESGEPPDLEEPEL